MGQTAMQELRSILIDWSERYRKSDMGDEFVVATKVLAKIEQRLLEKEREQIMVAYYDGFDDCRDINPQQYYNENYSQDNKQ